MGNDEPHLSADPSSLVESLADHEDELRDLSQGHHGHGPIETVRESPYRDHRIVVRTTYSISVDDVPIEGHVGVSDDGQVHYHAIPNLGFSSAIEMVEKLIDTFPEDFGDSYAEPGEPGTGPGGHGHDHGDTHGRAADDS
ncbi:MAG: hypothetical protein M3296_06095 [Actinomycetota bacterium]|nr:hypothetical protein [Actinomycetota bacterium]